MSRFQYPPNTRAIRVLCTGQVDPTYLLKALKYGADGVMVIGCRLGECHYIDGNYHARWKVDMTKRMLERIGFSPERTEMRFCSSAEGNKYIKVVKEFIEQVKSLGPSFVMSDEKGEKIRKDLDILIGVASGYRLRAVVAKQQKIIEEGNVYNEKIPHEEIDRIIDDMVYSEFIRESIISFLKGKSHSCHELADKIKIPAELVLSHLTYLRRKNIIDVDAVKDRVPLYKVL